MPPLTNTSPGPHPHHLPSAILAIFVGILSLHLEESIHPLLSAPLAHSVPLSCVQLSASAMSGTDSPVIRSTRRVSAARILTVEHTGAAGSVGRGRGGGESYSLQCIYNLAPKAGMVAFKQERVKRHFILIKKVIK